MEASEKRINTPEGRLLNNALWEKEAYKNPKGQDAEPLYKIEMVFPWDAIEEMEALVVQVAIEEWGEGAEEDYYDKEAIISPTRS